MCTVLEDLIGEYVLNISKENLKLAALKGKVKLDNVELDGDFIGSHVLGAVGLSGFGVLSCWARSLQINVPWSNLDEPTCLEIHGMHLVCVPLLPTTANRMYYGGGISGSVASSHTSSSREVMQQMSLRTRAKRSALARFERNFFSGRMHGEEPQLEREQNDSKTLKYNGRRRRWSMSASGDDEDSSTLDVSVDSSIPYESGINESVIFNKFSSTTNQKKARLPALKKKITTKVYQNLISSVNDVHIRFEVPPGGMDMSSNKADRSARHEMSDQRAFAFGLTLKCLSMQNVTDEAADDINDAFCSVANKRTHKKIEIKDMSIYWDDGPKFLLTESDLLRGLSSVPVSKWQKYIADAMQQISVHQEPEKEIRSKIHSSSKEPHLNATMNHGHDYICCGLSQTIRTTFVSEDTGSSSYGIDLLPCNIDFHATSQQYRQYQLLQNAVLSQQRFDTMLHARPKQSAKEDPKAWWQYAILCVKQKPNSRPWKAVQQIVRCRKQYIDLVMKNLLSDPERNGFHGGLSVQESQALFELEDLLPVETLLAFHLLALRRVFAKRCNNTAPSRRVKMKNSIVRNSSTSSFGRLLKSFKGSSQHDWQALENDDQTKAELPLFPSSLDGDEYSDALQQRDRGPATSTLQTLAMETTCELHRCQIRISLLESLERKKIVTVELETKGTSYDSGYGKGEVTCDIMRFEVFDHTTATVGGRRVLCVEPCKNRESGEEDSRTIIPNEFIVTNDDSVEPLFAHSSPSKGPQLPLLSPSNSLLEDPYFSHLSNPDDKLPDKVVCRVTAMADESDLSLILVAHPATLIWNKACADAVADFFSSSTPELRSHFLTTLQKSATPGAHKAQVAALYPSSLSIKVDVHAPKLWIPVSAHLGDGALYVDAGKVKVDIVKPKMTAETKWSMDITFIQVKFARGYTVRRVLNSEEDVIDLDAVSRLDNEFTIIYPFQVGLSGKASGISDRPGINGSADMTASFGKVRLNLVDVEELARAIGRFYASELARRKAKADAPNSNHASTAKSNTVIRQVPSKIGSSLKSPTVELMVYFEHIEVALESYSLVHRQKSPTHGGCVNRTYLMEITGIKLQNRSKGQKQFTRLTVNDFAIVQLTEAKHNDSTRVRYLKQSGEPRHRLLSKKEKYEATTDSNSLPDPVYPQTPKRNTPSDVPLRTPNDLRPKPTLDDVDSLYTATTSASYPTDEFIRACHFHDGDQHIDEVEFDVTSLALTVTPTSIQDIKVTVTRLFELIKLTSREMERKVHAGRRRARAKDKRELYSAHRLISLWYHYVL